VGFAWQEQYMRSTLLTRWPLVALGLCLVAAIAAGMGWFFHGPKPAPALAMDAVGLSRPDALLQSRSLSQLPKDLLAIPFLRDTLTEDFVFYYQAHADRLGLIGSLRRIIYEHDLSLQDNLIEQLLDQPADVALWRGLDGRLNDFLLVMDRGGLARVLEPLAHVALDDQQLSKLGDLSVNGHSTGLYQLNYNASKSLAFAAYGDKLVVLSNPARLYNPGDGANDAPGSVSTTAIEALLGGAKLFPEAFGLVPGETTVKQRLTVNASVLALGYQRFIPNFAGLRFEMDDSGWHSFLALDEVPDQGDLDFTPVWRAMPMDASACVALPLAAGQQQPLLEKLGAQADAAQSLLAHLRGSAGLCWYPGSRLYTPLLVASLDSAAGAELDPALGSLFSSMVGAHEANASDGSFPVLEQQQGNARTWQRQVSSRFGQYPASAAPDPDAVSGNGFFRVSLARHGATLLFSLDDKLLGKALDTLEKRFPPLADVLPGGVLTPVYLGPDALARLLQDETLASLPQDMEPVFHNAAQTLLLPRLRKLASDGKYALTLPEGTQPDGHWQWLPLTWQAL
jgi:uncharacterized protein YfaA (DUF2138 family)